MKTIELLKPVFILLVVSGAMPSVAFGEERIPNTSATPATTGTVSEADLKAFTRKWGTYRAFEYPTDAKDEPLLLAALKKDPAGPWLGYLTLKFATVQNDARKSDPAERARKYAAALTYLGPARETLKQAAQAQPGDETLRANAREIELATALAMVEAGRDLDVAKERLQEVLAKVPLNDGSVVYAANSTLGRIALRKGDLDEAKRRLALAGHTSGSPQLNSYGPDFILARELLEKKERAAVLQFLDAVERFWANPEGRSEANAKRNAEDHLAELEAWRKEINDGKVPTAAQWQ